MTEARLVCSITKQYTAGSCPDTRANNYAVSSLNIVNECSDEITSATTEVCNNVINKGARPLLLQPLLLLYEQKAACVDVPPDRGPQHRFHKGAPSPAHVDACKPNIAANSTRQRGGLQATCAGIIAPCSSAALLRLSMLMHNHCAAAAPEGALATSGIGQSDVVDEGKTCWEAPTAYYFVKNNCATDIPVTIKVHFLHAYVWPKCATIGDAVRRRCLKKIACESNADADPVLLRRCTLTRTSARARQPTTPTMVATMSAARRPPAAAAASPAAPRPAS